MRIFRLAQVAAEAELLRYQKMAARMAVRAAFGVVAAVFLIGAVTGLHVALALYLAPKFTAVIAALMIAGGDLLVAVVFGILAAVKGPGAIEREAYTVRENARQQLVQSATTASMIAPIARLLGNRSIFRVAIAALVTKLFTGSRAR